MKKNRLIMRQEQYNDARSAVIKEIERIHKENGSKERVLNISPTFDENRFFGLSTAVNEFILTTDLKIKASNYKGSMPLTEGMYEDVLDILFSMGGDEPELSRIIKQGLFLECEELCNPSLTEILPCDILAHFASQNDEVFFGTDLDFAKREHYTFHVMKSIGGVVKNYNDIVEEIGWQSMALHERMYIAEILHEPIANGYLDNDLYDDATDFGGKSFSDEKLKDFLEETEMPLHTPMSTVNSALKGCGIEPIEY